MIDDIREEPRGRPYELVVVVGGWQHRTGKVYAEAIRGPFGTATGQGADGGPGSKPLSQSEALVLMCIAYFQPITRGELSTFLARRFRALAPATG